MSLILNGRNNPLGSTIQRECVKIPYSASSLLFEENIELMSDEAVQAAEAPETQSGAQDVKAAGMPAAPAVEVPAAPEDVSYQAVEKEGTVTAIWEMQGQKHLRTIDPRSIEGKQILALFETAG